MEQLTEEPTHQANIATAPNNLASAVITDAQLIEALTAANKILTKTNNNLSDQLKQALKNNNTLVAVVKKRSTSETSNSTIDDNKCSNKRPRTIYGRGHILPPFDPNGYFWTHRFKVRAGHNIWMWMSQHKKNTTKMKWRETTHWEEAKQTRTESSPKKMSPDRKGRIQLML